jgi:hypothetical protein
MRLADPLVGLENFALSSNFWETAAMKLVQLCFPTIALAVLSVVGARADSPRPNESAFDFWIGTWEAHGRQRVARNSERWVEGTAVNRISAILGGRVIEERFDGSRLPQPLQGMSVSVYDPSSKKWKQTWVDDQGSYLDFVGEFVAGKMILSRTANVQGRSILQRMVFEDIKPDRFVWRWQSSTDQGRNWRLLWELHYKRLSSSPTSGS